ncbi:hypothetical protein IAU60_003125 [Kwoniella sp. DSM 27419]
MDVASDTESTFGSDIAYDEDLERVLLAAESQAGSDWPSQSLNAATPESTHQVPIAGPQMTDMEDVVRDGQADKPSLFAQFRRKGFLSVSDLVGPIWCETQYDYRLRTMPFLPPAQRPSKITSTSGKEIQVDTVKVEGKERVLRRGEKIHKRLEREIHPEEVSVKANTREDVWGLRFLNMLSAVEALLTLGKCREMPMVGFVRGVMIMGIIDEITREPIDASATAPATRATRATQTSLKAFFSPTKPRPVTSPDSALPEIRPKTHRLVISDSKTRVSGTVPREEDTLAGRLQVMMYKELLDAILLSPPGNTAATSSTLPSRNPFSWDMVFDHLSLDPSAQFSDDFVAQSRAVVLGNALRHGAGEARTLSDMKAVWARYVVDLGLGTVSPSVGKAAVRTQKGKGKEGDPNMGRTEDRLQLVYRRAEGNKKAQPKGEARRTKKRRKGTKSKRDRQAEGEPPPPTPLAEEATASPADSEEEILLQLAITESLKSVREPELATADRTMESSQLQASVTAVTVADSKRGVTGTTDTSRPPARQSERAYWAERDSEEDADDDELAQAIELSLNPDLEREEAEAEGAGEQGEEVVVMTSLSQRSGEPVAHIRTEPGDEVQVSPTSSPAKTSESPSSQTTIATESRHQGAGSVIGTTTFRHSPLLLSNHLESVLQFWMGEREPGGVTLEETRRCGWCEFEEGCEWRAKKAEEIWKSRQSQIERG